MVAPLSGRGSDYRALSFWHDTVPDDLARRPALDGDIDADVAIVGAGLTGLWSAHYLLERDPALRVLVLESEIAGFGASGRNGGWCSALFPRSTASLARTHGPAQAVRMRRAMVDTVDEVGRAASALGIDSDYLKAGTVAFARTPAQQRAARQTLADAAEWGVDGVTLSRLPTGETVVLDTDCARVHPAKLVRGLARAVERRGVRVAEGTRVLGYSAGRVDTDRGTVSARVVLDATEGYGSQFPAGRRRVLPLYSLMIATEPLPEETWRAMGIAPGQTFTDHRNLLVYGQRTADDRVAFGGRGARYHWGSSIRGEYDRVETVFTHLQETLGRMFPVLRGVSVTHRWGGPLGVPRDWHAAVRFDRATGLGSAGGYVGDGLSTTNLAGRTLADLVTGTESELTTLPWVNHRSPRWEPEPLRFLGANAGLAAMAVADVEERLTGRPSLAARVMGPLIGH